MGRQVIHNEDGYTVVEVLIALTLLTIITTVVGSVFIFTARQMNNWRDSVQTINDTHIITERLYNDALLSNQTTLSESLLNFYIPFKQFVSYSDLNVVLSRNEIQLSSHADSLYIGEVVIEDEFSQFEIVFVLDGKQFTHQVSVANRQPKLWEAMSRE